MTDGDGAEFILPCGEPDGAFVGDLARAFLFDRLLMHRGDLWSGVSKNLKKSETFVCSVFFFFFFFFCFVLFCFVLFFSLSLMH
jgi:hypothetical protein